MHNEHLLTYLTVYAISRQQALSAEICDVTLRSKVL